MATVSIDSVSIGSVAGINNPLDERLGYQLRRASAVMFAGLAAMLHDLGLTPTEASVLMLIAANPGIIQSDIGRTLAIKRANMVPIAAMFSDRLLIERDPLDGRSQGLSLSAAGRTLAATVRQRIDRHEAGFLADLPDTERAALVMLVRRVWDITPI